MFADPFGQLTRANLYGTNGDDDLALVDDGTTHWSTDSDDEEIGRVVFGRLQPYGANSFEGRISADSGDDLIVGSTTDSLMYDEVLRGNAGDDRIFGLEGADTIYGKGGDDYIDAGPGDDVIYGGNDEDIITGGPGADDVHGGNQNDVLFSEGNDYFERDEMRGEGGSNILCSDSLYTTLIGSLTSSSSGYSFLYYAEDAVGLIPTATAGNTNFDFCGHTDHGSFSDCEATLSAAPLPCAAQGMED
jgi:Ca2+-binding RTX toxin-like protein